MQLFFYGTLMDAELRRLVVGEAVAERLAVGRGVLAGYRRLTTRDGRYPALVRAAGGRVAGQLVAGLTGHALLRVAQFEGEEYAPCRVTALDARGRRVPACVFVPRRHGLVGRRPWNFRRWQRELKPRQMRWTRFWLREAPAGTMIDTAVPWHVRRRLAALDREMRAAAAPAGKAAAEAPEETAAFAMSSAAA